MGYLAETVIEQFNAEAGDINTLTEDATKVMWFNQGQARLPIRRTLRDTVQWTAGDLAVGLPDGFYALRRLSYHPDNLCADKFELLGVGVELSLIAYGDSLFTGAEGDGSAIIEYESEWPDVTEDDRSILPARGDVACVYYSLHRFYRLLGSNRAFYKRYATLTGANAVSMSDLQAEADRYLQDFTDTAAELTLGAPAQPYGG